MDKCSCGEKLPEVKVLHSEAGYYIGRFCAQCGPYSRDSGYFKTRKQAERYLEITR